MQFRHEGLRPGFLLEPLGWAAPFVLSALQQNPAILPHVAEMTPSRMHLIGLALSHKDDADAAFVETTISAPTADVLRLALGWQPIGFKATVADLDDRILERASYRALVELLRDHRMAKLLSFAGHVPERCLLSLKDIPSLLRPVALELRPNLFPGFAEGLKFLSQRAGCLSYEEFVASLAKARNQGQLKTALRQAIEDIPLPRSLPPKRVGDGVRIDGTRKLRTLAKDMHNCIANLIADVEQGQAAIYIWGTGDPIAILLQRHGRLGWFLEDVKGRGNTEIERPISEVIERAFAERGIPRAFIAHALEEVLQLDNRAKALVALRDQRV